MTFLPIDTGTPAVPFNIVDGIELNERFEGLVDTLSLMGYYAKGWIPVSIDGGFEYNTANSIRTGSDIDLTSTIQEGDKITWEHGTTGGDRFGWVSFIDYNDTVANRTYIEIIGDTVLDETIVSTSVGISRIANPDGWPKGLSSLNIYPVGSIYTSINSTNPNVFFGGTWSEFGAGRTMVGFNSGDSDFNASEKTGGVKNVTLTESQIPAHNHKLRAAGAGTNDVSLSFGTSGDVAETDTARIIVNSVSINRRPTGTQWADRATISEVGNTGGGQSHTNVQPYITVYMWKRTAI